MRPSAVSETLNIIQENNEKSKIKDKKRPGLIPGKSLDSLSNRFFGPNNKDYF